LSNTVPSKPVDFPDIASDPHSADGVEQPAGEMALPELQMPGYEQGANPRVISTGTYYHAGSHDFSDYSDEEGQEWGTDGETGEM
jgi:hypothetical protein